MIAGWMRKVGQVTAVVILSRVVAAIAPSTVQTNGDSPWLLIHGWKWSLTQTRSNPACSATWALLTSEVALSSSPDRKYPNSAMT